MAIKYEKGLLKVDQPVGEELSQQLMEEELIIPEGKPDIARILDIGATVYGTGKEVVQGQVMVEGIIRYNLLYIALGDDNRVVQLEEETGFTKYVDLEGAKPRMTADVSYELEHIDYDIENSRKLKVRTVLNIGCRVQQLLQLEVLRAFEDQEKIQALSEPIKLVSSAGDGSGQTIIREDVEIPADMPSAVEILRKDAKAKVLEKRVADNRVIAQGEVDVKLLYLSQEINDPVHLVQYQIPFTHFVEIQGAYQGMDCDARVEVQELDVSLRQDIVGDVRVLSIDMILLMEGRVYEAYEQDIIVDAYSPGASLDLKKEKILLTHKVGECQVQSVIRENIEIPENMPPVEKILYTEAKPLIADYRISDGQVLVDGVLTNVILYKPEDQELPISSLKTDIPFTQAIEVEGITEEMDCLCNTSVSYISHTQVSPKEFELKITLLTKGQVTKTVEKAVLLDVEELEQDHEEISGVYIYFVQPGDTLWSVAKRYNTTISSILKYNDIEDQEALEVGSKIIIFKKLDYSVT